MKCIVVDDEPLAVEGMKLNIAEVSGLELVGTFHDAMAANEFLRINSVDLMFLDINMPGMSGLEFIRSLPDPPLVILTTAYPQFALESYELDVLDYLVKPIRLERFFRSVNKARDYHALTAAGEAQPSQVEADTIYIRSERKFVRVALQDIRYIRGLKDYVVLHTLNARHSTAMNVKTIQSQLPQEQFARVSKSYIVNVRQIDAFDSEQVYIGEDEIPIGKAYREAFVRDFVAKKLIGRK